MSTRAPHAARLGDRLGVPVEWHLSLASTNERARELGRAQAADGTVVLADEQTAGRGRRGRSWYSPPGSGIYASVLVRSGRWLDHPELAQLGAGVAVAEVVSDRARESVELVWPNDCYVAGRKIAGVLVEAEAMAGALQFLVCGIGINLRLDRDGAPPELAASAIGLVEVARDPIDRGTLTLDLLSRLRALRQGCEADEGRDILERWRRRAPMATGTGVQVQTPGGLLLGTTAGLADDGALMLDVQGERHRVMVGEVVRLRRQT